MAEFEFDAPEVIVPGRAQVPGLLAALDTHADRNADLVIAINAVALFASDEERMQLLVDSGLLGTMRTLFKETKFTAPRAAIAQCLSLFATKGRFRDVVGVRYGFVSYGVARLIMIHATLGFPVLDMDEEARSKVFPEKEQIESMQMRLGALQLGALQEMALGLIVLIRLCCESADSATAAAKLPTVALLLDFLALFRDTEGHRYQLWQLNVLRLLKEMLSHATAASELASSRPMLARFIGLLSKSADNFMSREERIVSTGVLQGVWNMTAQLRLHATLIDVTLVDVLVRYAAGAAVELVGAEAWPDDVPEEGEGEAEPAQKGGAAPPAAPSKSQADAGSDSNRVIILRSVQLCLAAMVNLAASEEGCDALIPKVLGHACPAMWELLMINDNGVQLTLLRLFWRLYQVSRRSDRVSARRVDGRLPAGYELQQAAILRCCLRISNPEPVLHEAMRILDAIAVPESRPKPPKSSSSSDGGRGRPRRDLQTPLGFAELQEEVLTRGQDVGHLFAVLTNPPSNRTARAALRLVFRCANDAPPAAVVQIAQQFLELCADADIAGETPLLRIGPPDVLRQALCWVHHLLNYDGTGGRAELVGALAPQLLTDDWVPVLVDAFKTALEASLAGDGDDAKKVAAVADAAQGAGESLDVEGEPEHEDALPCAIVPLKAVFEYFRELCDMLLSMAATARGRGMKSLLDSRFDGGHDDGAGVGLVHCVLACTGIYSKQLWAPGDADGDGVNDAGAIEVYAQVMEDINELCTRLLLHFAIQKPSLLAAQNSDAATAKQDTFESSAMGTVGYTEGQSNVEAVGWLGWTLSRTYWMQTVLLALDYSERPKQVLASAQQLLLATEPAQAADGHRELLSVRRPSRLDALRDPTQPVQESEMGYAFEALEMCLRRMWDKGDRRQGSGNPVAKPLRFEAFADVVTVTHHLCLVLTRLLACLDVDGPFFIVGGEETVGEPEPGRRRSSPLVERLISTLVMLVGEHSLREDSDYAFLLTIVLPLWHLSTSPIHASTLLSAGRGSLVNSLSFWLKSDVVGPPNPLQADLDGLPSQTGLDDGQFGPGAASPSDLALQLRVRTTVCGILCCLSRLQASHHDLVRSSFLRNLLRVVGILDPQEQAEKRPGESAASGQEVWEDFVLGILRNILLADRSEPTAIALRPFIPWLADCLTETEKHYTEETDPAAPAALRDKSGVGRHPHHPKMVPAPHVRIVVDLMSETLLNREAFEQSVANRADKLSRAAAKEAFVAERKKQASEGLQWNPDGEKKAMAGAADVPKTMADPIAEEYKKLLLSASG